MADQHSGLPSESGVKQNSEEDSMAPSLTTVDMLARGFGMLEVAPLEGKTKHIEVGLEC